MSTRETTQDTTEKDIFFAALDQPSAEARAAFLAGACSGNPALRSRIEQLLAAHLEGDEFMKTVARTQMEKLLVANLGDDVRASSKRTDHGSSGGAAIPQGEEPGVMIDRYKLLEKLGEGGFGAVWLAEQREPVRRKVALKIIKLGMDTKQVVARFEAERQALALMDHPNIAKVHDAGTTETGRPYFVMELVRGMKITEYCDQNHLPTRQRLELFIKVCHAIQHAHQKGIIHRDIKPSNILITLHDGVPVPKVIDFGIAKATQGELTDKTIHTQFQQFIGTPAYMSPEQAEMSGLDIDTRSDIYSLGVLLYELLIGTTPFDAKEIAKQGLDAIRRAIRELEPLRPSTRLSSLGAGALTTTAQARGTEAMKLVGHLRGDLDWIVMKCLEKDRTRRYDTANGVAADLQRHLNDEAVEARPPSRFYEFQRTVRRHKVGVAATAAVIVALALGLWLSAWQALRATKAEKLATERLAEAARERDAKEVARQDAEATSKFLTEVFQSPSPNKDGRQITVAESLDKAAKRLEGDQTIPPGRRAKLQAALAKTFDALGLHREAITLNETVRDYHLGAAGPEHPDTLTAMGDLSDSLFLAGRWDESVKLRERVLELRRKVLGPAHLDTVQAMHQLSGSYAKLDRRQEAMALQERVLEIRRSELGDDDLKTLAALGNLAATYLLSGRREEALKMQTEAVQRLTRNLGAENAETLRAMGNLTYIQFECGQTKAAIELQEKLTPACVSAFGPEHPTTLSVMQNLALYYSKTGRHAEALQRREELLRVQRRTRGVESPDTLLTMQNLAVSYESLGRHNDALQLREEVAQLCLKVHGPEHSATLMARNNLANSYFQAGRLQQATALNEEVLKLRSKILGPEDPDTLMSKHNLAIVYAHLGRNNESIQLGEELVSLYRRLNATESKQLLEAMQLLAHNFEIAGRLGEALQLREELVPRSIKVHGPEHPFTLSVSGDLATSFASMGRHREAFELRQRVHTLSLQQLGPEQPGTATAMHQLAQSYSDAGQKNQAIELTEKALQIRRQLLGPEHRDTIRSMLQLSQYYQDAGPLKEAVELAEQVVSLQQRKLGPDHPDTLYASHNLAMAYRQANRLDESLKLHEQNLARIRTVFGPEHPFTLTAIGGLADAYGKAGRNPEALPLREQQVALRRKVLGVEHPHTLAAMINLALSYVGANRPAEALPMAKTAFELSLKRDPKSADTAIASMAVGFSHDRLDQDDDAIAAWQKAVEIAPAAVPEACYFLGKALTDRGRYAEALPILRTTLKQSPDSDRGRETAERITLVEAKLAARASK